MTDIIIDGSFGEGGGQILRSSLALSLIQGKPFHIRNIRANRKKPGLMHQHLTAVNAAVQIGNAAVRGNTLGSAELYFAPKAILPGKYYFSVGTAGSCTLVFQTVLPALLTANRESELVLEGGTHNPFAPPFDFLEKTFLPLICRMGADVRMSLECPGFYPAGGGKIIARIVPPKKFAPLELTERGEIREQRVRAMVSRIAESIGEREIERIRKKTGWNGPMKVEKITRSKGPGNVLFIEIESRYVTEVFSGFGKKGVRAEQVAETTLKQAREYLSADVPVGKYLADQLLIPMVLAGRGKIKSLLPTRHTTTNIEVITQFTDANISLTQTDNDSCEIEVR
jgi:RNA 3'-terminal phosphate cyclase (ATP)